MLPGHDAQAGSNRFDSLVQTFSGARPQSRLDCGAESLQLLVIWASALRGRVNPSVWDTTLLITQARVVRHRHSRDGCFNAYRINRRLGLTD